MAMLEVRDLEVYYGVIQAIKGISFDVDQGEIVALIGANGAGKTTTLHTITGPVSYTHLDVYKRQAGIPADLLHRGFPDFTAG